MGKRRPGKRTLAREAAMKVLYVADLRKDDVSPAEEDAVIREVCKPEDAQAYARRLVAGVRGDLEEIDRVIVDVTPNWKLTRMAATDRNIIRIGCWELLNEVDEVPPAVVINEGVGLAKRFGSESSGSFVNGVLDAIRKRREGIDR